MALTDKLTAIANAIRTKTGRTDSLTIDQMVSEIDSINVGVVPDTMGFVPTNWGYMGIITSGIWYGTSVPYQYFYLKDGTSTATLCLLDSIEFANAITSIGAYAFYGQERLILSEIPAEVKTIGDYALSCLKDLTTLTFKGTPESIGSNVFTGNFSLTTINVPWAEGAVEGAPWGAKNATINYNYTGE